MQRSKMLVRLFWALSDKTQKDFSTEVGVHPGTLMAWQAGKYEPNPEHIATMAKLAGHTVADGIEILQLCEDLRKPRQRPGQGAEDLFAEAGELFSNRARLAYQRMLRARLAGAEADGESGLSLK